MRVGDTIIAVAARGAAGRGRALIRLSGPDAFASARGILETKLPARRSIAPCRITVSVPAGAVALPGILALFPAPASYTGEDVLELQLPANRTLVERIMAALTAHDGVRLAGPGEFTARAFLHGRLDAQQAEGVGAMIAARSTDELSAARDLLDGRTGEQFRTMLNDAVELLALVEAGIDFTDQEDVVAIAPDELSSRLEHVLSAINQYMCGTEGRKAPTEQLRAVLVGPPNAGKSTLFNALLGRERAVTSEHAGTTRDALIEPLPDDAGVPGWQSVGIDLIDLAGFDEKKSPSVLDVGAQRIAREHIARASIIIQCDPNGRFEALKNTDQHAITIRVRTKADLPSDGGAADALGVCALDGWHLEALREAIHDAAIAWLKTIQGDTDGPIVLARHARALEAAREALSQAHTWAREEKYDPALMAMTLRTAVNALGEIGGRISPDDILGRIFSTFCVGK